MASIKYRKTPSPVQWRIQDFLTEGSELSGGPGTPFQKLKTHRIWFTIFWVGPRVPIKNESRIFLTPLSEILEVMRKQRVQNVSAIEVYLEVAQVDFMLPLD